VRMRVRMCVRMCVRVKPDFELWTPLSPNSRRIPDFGHPLN
jgi:hypothetical protein